MRTIPTLLHCASHRRDNERQADIRPRIPSLILIWMSKRNPILYNHWMGKETLQQEPFQNDTRVVRERRQRPFRSDSRLPEAIEPYLDVWRPRVSTLFVPSEDITICNVRY